MGLDERLRTVDQDGAEPGRMLDEAHLVELAQRRESRRHRQVVRRKCGAVADGMLE